MIESKTQKKTAEGFGGSWELRGALTGTLNALDRLTRVRTKSG
jgi:hypothetical protein